jgi:hypothetical protein
MNKVIFTIVLFAIGIALIISTVIPVSNQIKSTGSTVNAAVKNLNNNIVPAPTP